MKTRDKYKLGLAALAALLGTAACGGGADSLTPVVQPPAPPPAPVVFSEFVKTQFDNTANNTNPREVDDTDFAFDDADNPNAFDDLLANP